MIRETTMNEQAPASRAKSSSVALAAATAFIVVAAMLGLLTDAPRAPLTGPGWSLRGTLMPAPLAPDRAGDTAGHGPA